MYLKILILAGLKRRIPVWKMSLSLTRSTESSKGVVCPDDALVSALMALVSCSNVT